VDPVGIDLGAWQVVEGREEEGGVPWVVWWEERATCEA